MATTAQILIWWQSNRVPTVEQRNETFSSFRNLADKIPIADVEGLEDLLNTAPNELNATANFTRAIPTKTVLAKIAIVPTADVTISIGTYAGGNDIIDNVVVPAGGTNDPYMIEKYFHAGTTLYITGVTSNTYFKFFQNK